METEEGKKNEQAEIMKKPFKFTVTKIEDMTKRTTGPAVEEQKMRDKRMVIRSIKDPNQVIRGTKEEKEFDEEKKQLKAKKTASSSKVSGSSIGKLSEPSLEIIPAEESTIGFLETMTGPRLPDFSETESETTCERMSNDSETEETPSMLALFNSDTEDESFSKIWNQGERALKDKRVVLFSPNREDLGEKKEQKDKKPAFKKWKPKIKSKPMPLDPLMTEYSKGVINYLNQIGIYNFMKHWFCFLFNLNPKPEEPVKLLQRFLQESLRNAGRDSDVYKLEDEVRILKRTEDLMNVEISKLKHLTHLLAPDIYDEEGNMIIPEPSIEEEELVIEEEFVEPAAEVEEVPSIIHKMRGSKTKGIGKKNKYKKDKEMLSEVISKSSSKVSRKEKTVKRKKTGKLSKAK